MTTLAAQEFLEITRQHPQWAKTLTQDVTIIGEVILPENHPLKALSSKLIFQDHADLRKSNISVAEGVFHQGVNFSGSQIREIGTLDVLGTDKEGNAARFKCCKHLTVARGIFPGLVEFDWSAIQQIAKDFHVTAPDIKGYAASFYGCKHLTVARGTFAGFVSFGCSKIQEIAEDFHVSAPNILGNAASFWKCKELAIARGTFPGWVSFADSGIREIAEDLHVTAPNTLGNSAKFCDCKNLRIASGKFCGTVDFTSTPITHIRNLQITVPKRTPKAIFTEPCLKDVPFTLEEITVSKEIEEKLRPKDLQKKRLKILHKNLKTHLPPIPKEI